MRRSGFTLIELLVTVAIMLLVLAVTVMAVNGMNTPGERLRAGSRQLQSALLGARDRAIHAGRTQNARPVGLRFQIDSSDNTVSSFVYVQALPPHRAGDIQVGRSDPDSTAPEAVNVVRGRGNTGWYNLKRRGLIGDGSRIQLPYGGSWYSIDTSALSSTQEVLYITPAYRDTATINPPPANENAFPVWTADPSTQLGDYQLELFPAVMPGQEPIRLPSGTAINIARSRNTPPGSRFFDVMFSARGTVHGPLASKGLVHFFLADIRDITEERDPAHQQSQDSYSVTLFTQSGHVSSFAIDRTDADNDGEADNPFSYAESGEVANR